MSGYPPAPALGYPPAAQYPAPSQLSTALQYPTTPPHSLHVQYPAASHYPPSAPSENNQNWAFPSPYSKQWDKINTPGRPYRIPGGRGTERPFTSFLRLYTGVQKSGHCHDTPKSSHMSHELCNSISRVAPTPGRRFMGGLVPLSDSRTSCRWTSLIPGDLWDIEKYWYKTIEGRPSLHSCIGFLNKYRIKNAIYMSFCYAIVSLLIGNVSFIRLMLPSASNGFIIRSHTNSHFKGTSRCQPFYF